MSPILALQLLHAREEADEGGPRIGVVGGGAREHRDLLDARLAEGVDQLLLVGEPAVDRAHPDAGLARDVVVRGAQPALCEHHARRVQDAPAVALRVATEGALGGGSRLWHEGHDSSKRRTRLQSETISPVLWYSADES